MDHHNQRVKSLLQVAGEGQGVPRPRRADGTDGQRVSALRRQAREEERRARRVLRLRKLPEVQVHAGCGIAGIQRCCQPEVGTQPDYAIEGMRAEASMCKSMTRADI